MVKISRKVLFYSMIIISLTSFINMSVLYWVPIQIPLSLHSVTGLMLAAYFLKAYYLIPICFSICALIFFSAFSFLKQQIFLPIVLFVYLLCDLFFLVYSFFNAWFTDAHFIAVQAIQIVISSVIITFMCIYLRARCKTRSA